MVCNALCSICQSLMRHMTNHSPLRTNKRLTLNKLALSAIQGLLRQPLRGIAKRDQVKKKKKSCFLKKKKKEKQAQGGLLMSSNRYRFRKGLFNSNSSIFNFCESLPAVVWDQWLYYSLWNTPTLQIAAWCTIPSNYAPLCG